MSTPSTQGENAETTTERPDLTILDRMRVGGQLAGERLLAAQKLSSDIYLHGEEPPTRNQVSAVLHALADHGLMSHMNSETVLELGDDRANLGRTWRQDIAHGRFFQAMGDSIAEWHDPREQERAKAESAELSERAQTAVTRYRENDGIDQRDTDAMADFVEHVLSIVTADC